MHLVDNVYLILSFGGSITYLFAQFAYIVHRIVARCVNLQNIDVIGVAKLFALRTFAAWRAILRIKTIDRLGKNPCDRGLACAARTGKKIRMRYASALNLIGKSANDMFLTDYLIKGVRSVFAIQRNVCHKCSETIIQHRRAVCNKRA